MDVACKNEQNLHRKIEKLWYGTFCILTVRNQDSVTNEQISKFRADAEFLFKEQT